MLACLPFSIPVSIFCCVMYIIYGGINCVSDVKGIL